MANKKILLSLIVFLFFFSFLHSQSITWSKVYGGNDEDVAYSVKETSDGGYIIVGYTKSFNSGNYHDIYLIKTDSYGDTLWTRVFGSDSTDEKGISVCPTYDGGYMIAGHIWPGYINHYDVYIIKTDSTGNMICSKTYDMIHSDYVYEMIKTEDSCYVIVGMVDINGGQGFILKIDNNADSLWRKIDGYMNTYTSVKQMFDGNYIYHLLDLIFLLKN